MKSTTTSKYFIDKQKSRDLRLQFLFSQISNNS